MENTDLPKICKQFAQATLPYIFEIDTNHRNILLSIGQEVNQKIRVHRGYGKSIGRLANVLYGATLNHDTEFIFKKVIELVQNKQQNTNLVEDKIRIVQTVIS